MPLADRTRWDARHRQRIEGPGEPEPFLLALADRLPRSGRALDLAGGWGRNAARLAARGLDVTVADISPIALGRASRLAFEGTGTIQPLAIDLEEAPFPAGPWELILCVRFLHRPTYRAIPDHLAGSGLAIVVHPTSMNLERNARPGRRHLLEPGELPGLLPGLEVVQSSEGWTGEGRHEAHFLGQRPPRGPG